MARKYSRRAPIDEWARTRTEIYADVFARFWNPDVGALVQYEGATKVDASCLLMPLLKFIPRTDPRWISTLGVVGRSLAGGAFTPCYNVDEVQEIDHGTGEEGSSQRDWTKRATDEATFLEPCPT